MEPVAAVPQEMPELMEKTEQEMEERPEKEIRV